jgi:hypothetical protein
LRQARSGTQHSDMLPYLVSAIAFWGTVLGGGFYFARRYARALEGRTGHEAELVELRERVNALEDALDVTRREVERLETAQEFTTRLMAPRDTRDGRSG